MKNQQSQLLCYFFVIFVIFSSFQTTNSQYTYISQYPETPANTFKDTGDRFSGQGYYDAVNSAGVMAGFIEQSGTFHSVTQNYFFPHVEDPVSAAFATTETLYCKQEECSTQILYYGDNFYTLYFYTRNTNTANAADSVTEIIAKVILISSGAESSVITVASGNAAVRQDLQVSPNASYTKIIVSWIENYQTLKFSILDFNTGTHTITLNPSFDLFGTTLFTTTTNIYTQSVDWLGYTGYMAIWSEYDGINTEGYFQPINSSDLSAIVSKVNVGTYTGLAAVRGFVYPLEDTVIGVNNSGDYFVFYYNGIFQLNSNVNMGTYPPSAFTTDIQINLFGSYIVLSMIDAGSGILHNFYKTQSDSTIPAVAETSMTSIITDAYGINLSYYDDFLLTTYIVSLNSNSLSIEEFSAPGCDILCDSFSCNGIMNKQCTSCSGTGRITTVADDFYCWCQTGFYSDKNSANCIACTAPCTACFTSGIYGCTACDPTHFRQVDYTTGECVCQDGYYEDFPNFAFVCQLCNPECVTCDTSPDNCLTCGPNKSGSNCACINGYEQDINGDCQLIPIPCQENQYRNNIGECKECHFFNPDRYSLDCKCPTNFHEENGKLLCVIDDTSRFIDITSQYVDTQSIVILTFIIPLSMSSKMYMILNVVDYSQMLFMFLYVNVRLSPSYNSFLQAIADFQLPFLPNFFQFFFQFDEDYQIENAPSKFQTQDQFNTAFYLYNSGGCFSFLVFPTCLYIIVKIGNIVAKKLNILKLTSFLQKLIIRMEWNYFVEIIFIDFLNYMFAQFLQFYSFEHDQTVDIFNYIVWSITGVLLILYVFFQIGRVFNYTQTRNEQFRIKYENCWNGLDYTRKEAIVFNFYLLIRKITFAFIIVFFHDYTSTQMALLTIQNLAMILMIIQAQPYKDKVQQAVNILTEVMFMYIQLQIMVYCNVYTCNSKQLDLYIISLVVMGCHFLVIIYNIAVEIKQWLRKSAKPKLLDRKDDKGRRKNVNEHTLNMKMVAILQELETKLEKKRRRKSTKRLSLVTKGLSLKNKIAPLSAVKKQKKEDTDSDTSAESIIDDYNVRMEKQSFIKLARTLNILPRRLDLQNKQTPRKIDTQKNMLKQVIMSKQFRNYAYNQQDPNNLNDDESLISQIQDQQQTPFNLSFNPGQDKEELKNIDSAGQLISNFNNILNQQKQIQSAYENGKYSGRGQRFNFQEANLDISNLQQSSNASKIDLLQNRRSNQFQEDFDSHDEASTSRLQNKSINSFANQISYLQQNGHENQILQEQNLNNIDLPHTERQLVNQKSLQQDSQSVAKRQRRQQKNKIKL